VATKLAPKVFHTQMVALFFLSVALGTAIAGQLAEFYTVVNEATYFGVLGAIAVVLGAVLWLMRKPVLRLMAGVR
jgi:proton-dependent oligopeptide transporter, POT family